MEFYHLYVIAFLTAFTIDSAFGTMLSSSFLAYGIGASMAVTLWAGPLK